MGQHGAKMGPRWGQEGAKRGQDGPRWGQDGAQMGHLEPPQKTLKKGSRPSLHFGTPKLPQNGSKNGSKSDPILDQFFDQFWGRFWSNFGRDLGGKTGSEGVKRSPREPNKALRSEKDYFQKSGFRIGLSTFFRS